MDTANIGSLLSSQLNTANIGSLLSSQLRRADGNSSTPSPLPQLPPLMLSSVATPIHNRMQALHAEVQALARSSAPQGMSEYERAAIRRSAGARQARLGASAPYRPLGGYGAPLPRPSGSWAMGGQGPLPRSSGSWAAASGRSTPTQIADTTRGASPTSWESHGSKDSGSSDDEAAASILLSLTPGNSPGGPAALQGIALSKCVSLLDERGGLAEIAAGAGLVLSRNPSGLDGITPGRVSPVNGEPAGNSLFSPLSMAHRSNSMEDLRFHR